MTVGDTLFRYLIEATFALDDEVRVEIRGLDIYDPVRDEVKARDVADIACWMV
jgi:hypothetical protein